MASDGPRGPIRRAAWQVLGVASLVTGLIGVVVPLLPTTVFLLVSAFAFERGSDRLHNWLVTHPRFGPPIETWRRHRAIARRAKMKALLALGLVFGLSVALGAPGYALAIQAPILVAVSIFIVTRPLPPDEA
ncbi:MAG: YbaN family protein [Methyloligellaceae bacterium]